MSKKKPRPTGQPKDSLDHLGADTMTDAEALRAWEADARREVSLPAQAFVVGEPVTAVTIGYPGHPRAGLRLTCVRSDRPYVIGLADASFLSGTPGAAFLSRYRAWLGLDDPALAEPVVSAASTVRAKVTRGEIVIGAPIELVVLACKQNALRCRVLGTNHEVTLRAAVHEQVPGSIISVIPTREWTHARHPYISGEIQGRRFEATALGLEPLCLREEGYWDPKTGSWGMNGKSRAAWAVPMIERGRRPMFEMEQVLPEVDSADADAVVEAADLAQAGDSSGAYSLLMKILEKDLRCLDAHAHLGNIEFDRFPEQALAHYGVGVSIAELALGKDFVGVLPWGLIDNRPFLRCLHGSGLSSWRIGDSRAASEAFTRLLWLNPNDNQGARFCLSALESGKTYEQAEGDEE